MRDGLGDYHGVPRVRGSCDVRHHAYRSRDQPLFESLYSPYVTGNVLVVDSAAMSSQINFNGTERCRIRVYVEESEPLETEMVVYSVSKTAKSEANDQTSTYVLELIEPFGFYDGFARVRGSYSGNLSDIVREIYREHLGQDIDAEQCHQRSKVVVPNLSPVESGRWLAGRATSDFGEPFFLYSSLRDGPAMSSLGELCRREQHLDKPYLYTSTPSNTQEQFERMARKVITMNIDEQDNVLAPGTSWCPEDQVLLDRHL